MATNIEEAEEPIYDAAIECEKLFEIQIARFNQADNGNGAALLTELSHQFSMWANSMKVFVDGDLSLDRKLQGHSEIQDQVLRGLDLMQANLAYAHIRDAPTEREEAEYPSPAQPPRLSLENLEAVSEALKRLHQIGMAIRRSSIASHSRRARKHTEALDLSSFTHLASLSLKALFATARAELLEQLTASMTDTYRLFLYRRKKMVPQARQRISRLSTILEDATSEGTPDAAMVESGQSQSTLPNANSASPHHPPPPPPSHSRPTTIDTREASSRFGGRRSAHRGAASILVSHVNYPKPAEGSKMCDWCFSPILEDTLKGDNWRQHVNEDHRPFVCISEECMKLSSLPRFSTSSRWLQHMLETHGIEWHRQVHAPSQWVCPLCYDIPARFSSPEDLERHLDNDHSKMALTGSQKGTVIRQSRASRPRPRNECPLCCLSIKDEQDSPQKTRNGSDNKRDAPDQKAMAEREKKRLKTLMGQKTSGLPISESNPEATPSSTILEPEVIARHVAGHLRTIMLLTLRIISIDGPLETSSAKESVSSKTDDQLSQVTSSHDSLRETCEIWATSSHLEEDQDIEEAVPENNETITWHDARGGGDHHIDEFLHQATERGAIQSHLDEHKKQDPETVWMSSNAKRDPQGQVLQASSDGKEAHNTSMGEFARVVWDKVPYRRRRYQGMSILEQPFKEDMVYEPHMKTESSAMRWLTVKPNHDERFERNFQIDHTVEPISLSQCFEDRQDFFTEKTKRILSLIIGYAVLHLHGTSWLQPGWGSSNIKFFQTTSGRTPLRPCIEAQLPKAGQDTTANDFQSIGDDMEDDDDELDSGHCCPEAVALAVVLMEVYFAKPFKRLAAMHDIQLIETKSGRITLIDVDQVLEGDEENEEGWRSQIPEDSPLLEAINNCLDAELWEDEEGQPLDSATLRLRMYQKVVRPLELDLTNGFRNIQLDEVDQYARNLDFGKWGQPMSSQESDGRTGLLSPREVMPMRSPSPGPFALLSPGQFAIGADAWKYMHHASRLHSLAPISTSDMDSVSNSDFDYKAFQFFDDQVGDGEHSAVETDKYIRWRSEYGQVYKKFVGSYLQDPPSQPVKIAVLDTGIDRDHFVFEAREENLKGKKNCYNESQKNVPDTHGHGTFTANLILDYAPDASLYVIKIADKENTRPDAKIVANAINHAIDKWDVDIISMPFGWPSSDFDGYDALQSAIDKAISRKVLMFAAAANSGGRLGRAYPASSSQVICVHSTNTNGSASDFSPTAEPNAINIATVGESVQSAWPMLLCQNNNADYLVSRSGTSYATPIVAGMAAFLLQYARLHLSEGEALALKRREKMEALLRRCAMRGPSYQPRDGYFFVHLSLDKHNLFGGELDWVSYEISKALKT